MSKIFEAYRKRVGETADLGVEIGRVGSLALFPPPQGSQVEEFGRLANRLLGDRTDERGSVLSVASSAPREGASFVSYNAAVILASVYHQKVAWIDGNFLSPQKKLIGADRPSLSALLKSPSSVDDLPFRENPLLVAGGVELVGAKGLLVAENYETVLKRLAMRFDFVLLDLPPVLATTDTALMARATDGLLLVIQQKHLKREVIEHGMKGLKEKGVRLIGSVINRRAYELPKLIYDRM